MATWQPRSAPRTIEPRLVTAVLLIGGGIWLRSEIRASARIWEDLTAELKETSL